MTHRIFITAGEVAALMRIRSARSFLQRRARLERDFDFPPPLAWTSNPMLWRRETVEHWIEFDGHVAPERPDPAEFAAARNRMLREAGRA